MTDKYAPRNKIARQALGDFLGPLIADNLDIPSAALEEALIDEIRETFQVGREVGPICR